MSVLNAARGIILAICLLSGTSIGLAGERFTDNGDGTITDHQERLMWAKYDNQGDINWHEASLYCRTGPNQVLGKYHNWRMPTIKELETLFLSSDSEPSYEADCGQRLKVVPHIKLSCGWIWSGEVRSITARVYNFHRGYSYTDRKVHKRHYRALPVRTLDPDE